MSNIIAVTNQKGGVGKTTTAYNLGASLAKYKKKVLLIDLDPQGNCGLALGIDSTLSKKTVKEFILNEVTLDKAVRKTNTTDLFLMPCNLSLAMVDTSIDNSLDKSLILYNRLKESNLNLYDYVLLDCPPSLGFLSLNALNCANYVLIPMLCESFSLDALSQLLSTIASCQSNKNTKLKILGILVTMFDSRSRIALDTLTEIKTNFGEHVFTTIIPRNVTIVEAIKAGIPALKYKPTSQGALSYLSLAREVIERTPKE